MLNLLGYCSLSLLFRIAPMVMMFHRRVCELWNRLRGTKIGRAEVELNGSIILLGPETWLKVINAAVTQLKSEDPTIYSAINAGRKCVVFAGGTSKGDPQFEFGTFFLNKAFVKSQDALISFFVFWRFFEERSSIFQRADPETVKIRKVQAREQTAQWLENHGRPAEFVQWLRAGGLDKRIDPPSALKRTKGQGG